jgi:glucose-6-phosphate 1-epimerase
MSMGRFANSTDPRSGLEVVRDWNGVAQVVLRSPKGASARVGLPTADLFY